MTWVLAFLLSVAGAVAIYAGTHAFWRARSHVRRTKAGPPPIRATRQRIWEDRGPVETLDLAAGAGGPDGAPQPPFIFLDEHKGGLRPCVSVRDARRRTWRVKWGNEVHSEPFASRIAWAAGYFVTPSYFVPSGRIEQVPSLEMAGGCIDEHGAFQEACFQLDDAHARKMFDEHGWAWNDNPFVGTRELNGLRIVLLLVSNWDNKDVRDVARGSNTGIFEFTIPDGTSEARYLVTDWGGSMGSWGTNVVSRGKWDADAYLEQSAKFITGVDDLGHVTWGFSGQRTADAVTEITMDDVRWFAGRFAPVSDEQLRGALAACGATPEEVDRFAAGLRRRLDQLVDIAERAAA